MADVDIDPFGEQYKPDVQPDEMGETTPFTLGGVTEGRSTLEPEQESLFGGTSIRTKVLREHVEG